MVNKVRENYRRIVGWDDDFESLSRQRVKEPIGARRGIAYLGTGGAVSTVSGDTATTDTGTSVPISSSTSTTWDTYTKPYSRIVKQEDTLINGSDIPNAKVGDTIDGILDVYDCTTGGPQQLDLDNTCYPPTTKINCVDVCVDPQPDPTYLSGWTWQTSGFGYGADSWHYTKQQCFDYLCYQMISANIANGHLTEEQRDQVYCSHPQNNPTNFGVYPRWIATNAYLPNWDQYVNVRQLECSALSTANQSAAEPCYINDPTQAETCPAEIYTQQCEEHPWDTCECYHIEKRGTELKAGWDSAEYYTEPVNCAEAEGYTEGTYCRHSFSSSPVYPRFPYLDAKYGDAVAEAASILAGITYTFSYFTMINSVEGRFYFTNGSYAQYRCSSACGELADWYCNPTPEDLQICDQYPELCENGETDPTAEDCNPYPITQAEDCCPPQDATTPQGCNWDSDGTAEMFWDEDQNCYKANANDPDATLADLQCHHPAELNMCDQFGNPIRVYTGTTDGSLVITYDPQTSGGIAYIVRDADGKITAAGSGSSRDLYINPDDPRNWN